MVLFPKKGLDTIYKGDNFAAWLEYYYTWDAGQLKIMQPGKN
jgi:hypothetical protein